MVGETPFVRHAVPSRDVPVPAVVPELDKVTCASLMRLRKELLRKFGAAPNSVNPFIGFISCVSA